MFLATYNSIKLLRSFCPQFAIGRLTSLRSLLEEARLPSPPGSALQRGIYVSRTRPALLDAVSRLLRLLQSPAEISVLAPMIEREILFRLLQDESSVVLHQVARANSPPQRIGVAIVWLKKHFRESLRVEDLARRVGMSTSGFHQWFRNITGMSPLQYQKQLRLQEARSILRNERKDVGTVSRRVGLRAPHSSAGSTVGCLGIHQSRKSATGFLRRQLSPFNFDCRRHQWIAELSRNSLTMFFQQQHPDFADRPLN